MRKQYHIREVNGDTLAWDVDKLVKISEHYLPKEVMIESIDDIDKNFWFQGKDDVPSVREIAKHIEYAEKLVLNILLFFLQMGVLWMACIVF